MTVPEYLKKLNSINVESILGTVINQKSKELIKVNQDNLDLGLNSKDQLVGDYETSTARLADHLRLFDPSKAPKKDKMPGAHYNFYWTGRLYDGIFITYQNKIIHFDSTGKGTGEKLSFVDSNKLLGVSGLKALEINFDILLPQLQTAIKQILCK